MLKTGHCLRQPPRFGLSGRCFRQDPDSRWGRTRREADIAVRLATDNYGPATEFPALFHLMPLIAIVILTKLMDFVVLVELAIVAIFPNVAAAGIEERVVTPAI